MPEVIESVERALRQLRKERSPIIGIGITLNKDGDYYEISELAIRPSADVGGSDKSIKGAINEWLRK